MKSFKYGTGILLAGLVLFVAWLLGRGAFAQENPKKARLPESCTLLAMPPAERAAHLARLAMLGRAASVVTTSPNGFSFEVNLAVMPLSDLQRWTENEQKCCSYLKIESQTMDEAKRARVHVVCPADLRSEVIQSFGLKSQG